MTEAQKKSFERIYNHTLKDILNSKIFWLGLVIKIICSIFFASNVLKNLFLPFVEYFAQVGGSPYAYFLSKNPVEAFPYPALMLYIFTFFIKIFSIFANSSSYPLVANLIFRIPVLIADILILTVLCSFLKNDKRKVLLLYWFSPILIYINYLHGQLDVVPMAFLFASLYFLIHGKSLIPYVLLGCSMATKTHMVLVLPLFLIFSYRQNPSYKKILIQLFTSFLTFLLINAQFFNDPSFVKMVFHNSQQEKIFKVALNFSNSHSFNLIISAYGVILLRSLTIKTYNKNILIIFLGFTFGVLTFFIPPSQGWYYWIIPLFIFSIIRSEARSIYHFVILNFLYFLYFLIIKESDYYQILSGSLEETSKNLFSYFESIGWNSAQIENIVFTLLQTSILVNCFQIYKSGFDLPPKFAQRKV